MARRGAATQRDTGRWVARAAATGGGRTYRGQMPVRWYTSLVLIVLLGVAAIVYSRYELQHPSAATQPAAGKAHWYASLGIDVCGTLQPDLPANPNEASASPGLFTVGDGVVQIAPSKPADAGNNATLARFVALYPKLKLTQNSLQLPGKAENRDGAKCPAGTPDAGKPAQVRIKVWPSFSGPGANSPTETADPASVKFANGQLITIAFVPANASIPKPSATAITAMLNDISGQSTTTTTAPATTPTTTAPTTTVPPSTTTSSPTTTTTASTTTTTTPATTTTTP